MHKRYFVYNMRYIVIFLLFSSLLSTPSIVYGGKYPIQNFTPIDYKAGIQNIYFEQNKNMTLFVANNLGVLTYNGNGWEVHTVQSGKKVRSLAFNELTKQLFVGSQGAIGYFEEDWNYVSLMEKVPSTAKDIDEVWDVYLLNSKVYFCTFQGIYVYDGTSISVIEGNFDRSFLVNGKLFTQNEQGKLYEIKNQELVSTYSQNKNAQIIAGIVPKNEGLLLIYNSGEIEFSTSFGIAQQYDDLMKVLQGKYVNHVLQLSDNRLVISTQTAGIFIYDLQNHKIENITIEDGLETNACLHAFQDYSGNLWVGMQNGIALIDINSPIRFINQEINLNGSGYEAFEVEEGTYYTTSNGIYFLAKNTDQSIFLSGTEGPAYGMQKIMGHLYAGHHTGLFLLEKGKAIRKANTDGLWEIKQLRSKPEFVIGGTYSGLYLFKIGSDMFLQPISKISGFEETSRFFEEDKKGRIWVGQFYKGLYQLTLTESLKAAKVKKVSENSNLPIKEQIILSRINNEIYLATDAGIYQLDQTTDRIVKADFFTEHVGEQPVYLLVQDHKKNIHVFGENLVGFYKQISSSNYAFVPSSLFQFHYSFNNDLLQVSVNTKNGILFNSNKGFINYKPELENRVGVEFPIIISKVYSVTEDSILYIKKPFEEKSKKNERLEVSYEAKHLQFEVESFHFNEMNKQQFRYLLKGFDDEYGEWTNMSLKEYTNLKEGEYEFNVQTRNYLGETLSSEPLLLTIKPPFHKSLFAKILYALLGVLTFFLISRRQKNRYAQQTRKVEEAKQKELALKQKELQEAEEQKAKELKQLEEDRIKAEMEHLNSLLTATTMNLVVKNEFMENIKEKLKDVKRKGKNKETKEALEQLVKEIDITLRLQEDWEQFEYHFNQVQGGFSKRLTTEFSDLTSKEQKLCAFLRLNLNTKDIANLMGISQRGVEVARYRLRKKLQLDKGQNLSKFILAY